MEDLEIFLSSFPYAKTTRRTYTDVLTRVLEQVPNAAELTAPDLLAIIQNSGWDNARQCVALAASKKYLTWKFGNQHPALTARIKRVIGKPQRSLDEETTLKLLASFNPYEPKGARDLAMCSLLLDTGLRCAEICRLHQEHTDTEKGCLQVIIKGGQWGYGIFSQETAHHIERWKHYRQQVGGQTFLFCNVLTGKRLTPEGLYTIVEEWGRKIGIKLSPHDLRRTYATLSTELTAMPEQLLMLAGRWKSTEMVRRYTRNTRLESARKHLIIPAIGKPKA